MELAVLGSGNGGCAVAFDCSKHGHNVRLFDFERFSENIQSIRRQGGIHSEGELTGFASISYAGHDLKQAVKGADVIFVVGPAYSTKPFAEVCRGHISTGQIVVVCPGSCGGSIEFKNSVGLSIRNDDVIVSETSTLPYAVRVLEPGKIKVFLKLNAGVYLAAVPARNTDRVLEKINEIYPSMTAAKNVLQTSLQNGNPILHPAIALLNAARIERTEGDFCFYEDGVTGAVGRLIEAVDKERLAISKRLCVEVFSDPELGCLQGYMKEQTYDKGYSEAPGFRGIRAPGSLDYRYFNEDVGYGLVFMAKLAEQIGVETPYMSAIIRLVSLLMNRDYLAEERRSMKTLGLSDYTARELQTLLT